ncbi:MAG: hypothetical protein AAF539_11670 [Planctomycetota bacterium]
MNRIACWIVVAIASGSAGCCGPLWTAGCAGSVCGGPGIISVGHAPCDGACGGGCDSCCGSCQACDGCGELYVDPWINHPPHCCDPCDACGNFNGQTCGQCRPVFTGIKSLWGYRCVDNCGGCDGCGDGMFPTCGGGACGGDCETCGPAGHVPPGGVTESPLPPGTVLEPNGMMGQTDQAIENAPPLAIQRNAKSNPRSARSIFQTRRVNGSRDPLAY